MKWIQKAFVLLYRIWFYIWVMLPILVMFPLLILMTLSEKTYRQFFYLARIWAKCILFGMGFPVKKIGDTTYDKHQSYMLVANHTSMIDIMLMLAVVRQPFVFVGKKELANIPIFGFFYKRTCILVDRSSPRSRKYAFEEAHRRLRDGTSICIFPEGKVPDDMNIVLDEFKEGAFRLAIEHQIPIRIITFLDNKKRFSYDFFSGGPGLLRVHFVGTLPTQGFDMNQRLALRKQVWNSMHEVLAASAQKRKV
ncbi:MAG: lysophospholipid acyltransferase family protein [Flavobacteriaceae bacterium]|nr:lysophospholipid acyltransferase family protein [Flavobacteriaceae bacterium]